MGRFGRLTGSNLLERQAVMKLLGSRTSSYSASVSLCPHHAAQQQDTARPFDEVPGPRPLPLLGNAWRLLPLIGQYSVADLAKMTEEFKERYGKIAKLSGLLIRPDIVFVYDADEIEKVFRADGATPIRPSNPCLVKYKSVSRRSFFGTHAGVVGVHGEAWREFRTRVQKPILQIQTTNKYIEPIAEVTDAFIARMNEMKDQNGEMPEDFDNEIYKWSLECIGRVALDVRLGCLEPNLNADSEQQKIIEAAKYALRTVATFETKLPLWKIMPTPLWIKYVQCMDYFMGVCMKYIDDARTRLKTKEVNSKFDLSLIERVLVEDSDPKIAYILALDLFMVGIDTISLAISSLLYEVATRPVEQHKIYEELSRILPDPTEQITAHHLNEMRYLKAFVKEVFRVFPTVIGNGRVLQNDMVLSGYRIPKGTQVVVPLQVVGNMEDHVSQADKFKPERWLRQAANDPSQKLHPFASLPFGYGPRMCLGRRFADMEIQIMLAKMIRSYKVEYLNEPLDYNITFLQRSLDGALKLKITEREECKEYERFEEKVASFA